MSFIVSSFIPFPNIAWWAAALNSDTLYLDKAEHFQKMTYRNRYYVSGSNGMIQLSIPLADGRDQRAAMRNIRISNSNKWQMQHWRTLVSVYNRTPFFEFYEHTLADLFRKEYIFLTDFNLDTIHWVKKQLGFEFKEQIAEEYIQHYETLITDTRNIKPGVEKKENILFPVYYQLFKDRIGFLPNLSILDLLFSEGPYAKKWMEDNKSELLKVL